MKRRQGIAAALLMLATMMVGSPATAQETADPTIDFVVTPSRLEVRVGPQEAIEFPIQIFNRGNEPLELQTYVQDIEIPDNDLVTTDELAFTASRWTSFSQELIIVPAGGSESVNVRVEIPEATPAGGYHAFAFFQTQPDESAIGVVPSGRIGVTLLVDVVPEGEVLVREARVSETSLTVSWEGLFSPVVEANTTIQNIGEAHIMAGGIHTHRAWPTGSPADVEVGPVTIFRGTQATVTSVSESVPWFGKATVTSEIVYQVGPDELPVILTQATAWIIPWHFIVAIVVIGAVVAGLIWLRRTRPEPEANQTNESEKSWEDEPAYS